MLTELLQELKDGKIHSLQELAAMLNTDIPWVKAQLEYLERQGYIRKAALHPDCSSPSCLGCKGCSPNVPAPVIWELTRTGHRDGKSAGS